MPIVKMHDASYSKTAVSIFALRDALLYFDNVIPMTGPLEVGLALNLEKRHDPYNQQELEEICRGLLFEVLPERLTTPEFIGRLSDFYGFSAAFVSDQIKEHLFGMEIRVDSDAFSSYRSLLEDYGLREYPLCIPPEFADQAEMQSDDLSLTITSLRLINTSQTTLQQLVEFRKDVEAKIKLRRFRLFAYENYLNKSRAFIEDDINRRLVDYDETVKKWGFETKAATFTTLIDSKMVAGGIAGSFITAYLHEPHLAVASTLLAAGITIGKISVELGKKRFALKELASSNPVSYVQYAQNKLNP
ncbi:MAG TPA: hypothetical protein VKT33_01130 [Candidatus Angelobacter sp.]|nr:hypothetical protein [Candidatus Angelobacter sp.]